MEDYIDEVYMCMCVRRYIVAFSLAIFLYLLLTRLVAAFSIYVSYLLLPKISHKNNTQTYTYTWRIKVFFSAAVVVERLTIEMDVRAVNGMRFIR